MSFLTKQEREFLIVAVIFLFCSVGLVVYLQKKNKQSMTFRRYGKVYIINAEGIEKSVKTKLGKMENMISYKPTNPYSIDTDIWNRIARDIVSKYHLYTAFVIKTDKRTLHYTASVLTFMIENLGKPIIVTGGNVESAVSIASELDIPEVIVLSNSQLLRGCRAIPNFSGEFWSPCYPVLNSTNSLSKPVDGMSVRLLSPDVRVAVLKSFPGMDKSLLDIRKNRKTGVVIELYDGDNTPKSDKFYDFVRYLTKKGILVVAVSQHPSKSDGEDFLLSKAGAIWGHDMTVSTAYAKLAFLLSNIQKKTVIRQLMKVPMRGEML